jgi:hypothetical protein
MAIIRDWAFQVEYIVDYVNKSLIDTVSIVKLLLSLSDVIHDFYSEFSHAVSLSLFDYLRKSRAQGFVVSLSGGADSSDYNN